MIEVGTKVEAFWGAYFPTYEGKVVHITEDGFAEIDWPPELDDCGSLFRLEDIHTCTVDERDKQTTPSPIGIWVSPSNA